MNGKDNARKPDAAVEEDLSLADADDVKGGVMDPLKDVRSETRGAIDGAKDASGFDATYANVKRGAREPMNP